MKCFVKSLLLAVIVVLCYHPPVQAVRLDGSLSGELYGHQTGQDRDWQPFGRLRSNLLAWESGPGRSLQFHTSMRWAARGTSWRNPDSDVRVYDLYAHLKGFGGNTDAYLGRQFVFNGVGSAVVDGGRIRLVPRSRTVLEFFGGRRVSGVGLGSSDNVWDNTVLGSQFGWQPDRNTRLSASWMRQQQNGHAVSHAVGLESSRRMGAVDVLLKASYDLVGLRLASLLSRMSVIHGQWYFGGEYLRRQPSVSHHSIFSVVEFYAYQIGRLEIRRKLSHSVSALANVHVETAGSDNSYRLDLGIRSSGYSLLWVHQTGYAGVNDGLKGTIFAPVHKRLDLVVGANLYRHRIQDEHSKKSESYSSTAGLYWRAGKGITGRTEIQWLSNAEMESNVRLLVLLAKSFSIDSDKGAR